MRYLICYDISDDKVRRSVVKYLEQRAWRVQYSVFSCEMTEQQATEVRLTLARLTAGPEKSLLLVTPLCAACAARAWFSGTWQERPQAAIVV